MEIEEDVEERRRRRGLFEGRGMDDGDDDGQDGEDGRDFEDQEEVNLEAFGIPLREWIVHKTKLARRFNVNSVSSCRHFVRVRMN